VSWTARITKAPDGELRLQFSEPLRHIDMHRATARHLAALLVVAAAEFGGDHQIAVSNTELPKNKPKLLITGTSRPDVRCTPRAKNSHERLAAITPQPKTSQTYSKSFMAENKAKRLGGGLR
jgi:hypothetical protein